MFREAMLCELKPNEFKQMTPGELFVYFDCYKQRQKEQSDFEIFLIWKNAWMNRCDLRHFPKLEDLIDVEKPVQTADEMLSMIKGLNARLGGEIR
jgi:hypothetical protein